jgi:hypothetical protein
VLVCRLAWNHPLPDGNKRGLSCPRHVHRPERRSLGT